ncbi:MAG: M28 family peptidase [bacterium]|nr:M28 family peptidase [bacterium]
MSEMVERPAMNDSLSAQALMTHVEALATAIGPRPAGQPEEARARQYIRYALSDAGLTEVEEMPFPAPNTWGYAVAVPVLIGLMASALSRRGWLARLVGGAAALHAAYALQQAMRSQKQPYRFLFPSGQSGNLIARIPAAETPRRRVVLIGHIDSNKHRLSFTPTFKPLMRSGATAAIAFTALNGLAQMLNLKGLRRLSEWGMGASLATFLADELGGFVEGANDNASAVACLLGLGAHLAQNPLKNTEVWLAFTGAEESGCLGLHHLLDVYRETLADAWFVDFEMVGAGQIAYVTRHSGFSHLSEYEPDPESLAWALETARRNPAMSVRGAQMTMTEEVGALRGRGFRGICLAGVGEDGWLVNWHQYSDTAYNIDPAALEKAARFGLAMLHTLDERQTLP